VVVIETEGLTKPYGKAHGIEDVTFSVGAGEVFGFLAPTALAVVLLLTVVLTCLGSLAAGAHLSFGSALAGYANVWPLALLFAGFDAVALAALGAWLFERRDLAG
jgi:hypothetical protein